MLKKDNENAADINKLAKTMGIQYPVKLSSELSELLTPNDFLSGLGIQFQDRVNNILSLLKGSLLPKNAGQDDLMPDSGVIIPIPLVRGPYIREEMVSIKADLMDDNGTENILLTVIRETE